MATNTRYLGTYTITEDRRQRAVTLLREGKNPKEIAGEIGVGLQRAYTILHEAGCRRMLLTPEQVKLLTTAHATPLDTQPTARRDT